MAEEQPNPLMGALLHMVQGRQEGEIAKVALLSQLVGRIEAVLVELKKGNEQRAELLELQRKR